MPIKRLDTVLGRKNQDVDADHKSNGALAPDRRTPAKTDVTFSARRDDGVVDLLERQRRTREGTTSDEERPGLDLDEGSIAIHETVVEADSSSDVEQTTPVEAPADCHSSGGGLISVEDIYRAAGILNTRMGCSINKVVEMISSDYLRGLSRDARRAALSMALDAAGISIDEVLLDAANRQDALDAYEAKQLRLFEEKWTRLAEENAQIQMEMEHLMAQYLDRINRNLDEVTFDKTMLARWQAVKQLQAQRISESVALCSRTNS